MSELFSYKKSPEDPLPSYEAKDILVLEGLEPVRRRPGMYIGGTDENALHHLVNEVFDNSMDEAVAGHATKIEIELYVDGSIAIRDNGRGIPIDMHPKFPEKSALEVILTTLHSGGKFNDKLYNTSGGLHGVGLSVVNALSSKFEIESIRNKTIYCQQYAYGVPITKLEIKGPAGNKKGCFIRFYPDKQIFEKNYFKPSRLYKLAKSKAYLYRGVEIIWRCDPILIKNSGEVPEYELLHFPGGIKEFLLSDIAEVKTVTNEVFSGSVSLPNSENKIEWAVAWLERGDGFSHSYCNTIYTPNGGTHENGLRTAIFKGLKSYGEMIDNKKISTISNEDVIVGVCSMLSIFIHDPQFQGQTKEKLVSPQVAKLVENTIKDHFDHWLSNNKNIADSLIENVINIAEERLSRKLERDTTRKSITHKIRLPGKLADCTNKIALGTEIFLVEGDSAGGSAKQARIREIQAILPLRGKVLNVANSTQEKIRMNQELIDLELALGCGTLKNYNEEKLRYEKVIIMTDADVDGSHIASLLMTYFYLQMPELIKNSHLYLAKPPLYSISCNNKIYYALSDEEKDKRVASLSLTKNKIEIKRFKGLGEMTAKHLKETTMDPKNRTLIKVSLPDDLRVTEIQVTNLMGKKPELRFKFIQEQALLKGKEIIQNLDL